MITYHCDLNTGKPMIQILNAMGTDLLAMGNHNFDYGPAITQELRNMPSFPWLGANISVTGTTDIQPFEPYKIFENSLGQRIGFLALIETPPSTGAKNIEGLTFNDPLATAAQLVPELRDQVNVLVVVSHNGLDFDERLAAAVPGIDLILGGHSHTYLSEPAVAYGVPIIQAGSDALNLTDLLVTQGSAVSVAGGATEGHYIVSTASLTEVDPEVQKMVDDWNALMKDKLDEKIGNTKIALNREDR